MSRSYKKPYVSTTCVGSRAGVQKSWKKERNKAIRNKEDISNGSSYRKEGGSVWDSPSDGKHYWEDEKGKRK